VSTAKKEPASGPQIKAAALITAGGKVSMDDREATECLRLVRQSIGDVIDLGTKEDNDERPAWAMDVLQNLRYIELQLDGVLWQAKIEAAQ
jgi:hypothetical protein